jgi:hypothetical protein
MQYRVPAFAAALSVAASVVSYPAAAGQFTRDSDVIGLNLAMPKNQVTDFIAKNFPNAPVEMLPVSVSMSGIQKSSNAGLVVEAHSSNSNDRFMMQNGVDRVKVLFDPNDNSPGVFAIYRYVNFENGSRMTMASLKASLMDKYGSPSQTSESFLKDSISYIWTAPGGHYNPRACALDRFAHYSYFYELVYLDRPLETTVQETAHDFANVVDSLAPSNMRPVPPPDCGTILSVEIRAEVGTNNLYAYEMKEDLVDLARGVSDLTRFSSEFFAAAKQAQNAKLSQDSANKPKL